ncbi:hypothetical protein [Streptomyces sp. NPDC045470]|uniref:hypothetical protein n=1 Tax=unclassified Streptomyces TaxID=2593676 RepID=UPI0033CEEBD0
MTRTATARHGLEPAVAIIASATLGLLTQLGVGRAAAVAHTTTLSPGALRSPRMRPRAPRRLTRAVKG